MVIGAAADPDALTVNGAYEPARTTTASPGVVAASTAAWIVQYGSTALLAVESEQLSDPTIPT